MQFFPFTALGIGVEGGVVQGDVLTKLPFSAQLLKQVHGVGIVEVVEAGGGLVEGDALVTRTPGVRLMIKSADCIPLVLTDAEASVVAAVHAGWRGLTADIVPLVIARLEKMGAVRERMRVGVGPSLGVECAEFSNPYEEIPSRYHWAVRVDKHVDLWAILERQLREAGVWDEAGGRGAVAERVEWMRVCTACHPEWFSWRRDKDARRFGTWVGLA